LSSVGGRAARNLRPAGGLLEQIAKLLWRAKEDEKAKELPGPTTLKQIEPPRKALAAPDDADEQATSPATGTDEELPF
jgi:hypothetical protein